MKKIVYILIAVAFASLFAACSKNSSSASDAEIAEIEASVADVTTSREKMSHIDSLALMADDLTPSEAMEVLLAYMRIINNAKATDNTQLQLETMRKYVDVYDIVLGADRSGMTDAFARLARHNATLDLAVAAKDYRAYLADYADGQISEDGSAATEEAPKAATDSTAAKPAEQPKATEQPAETTETTSELD